jgi:hypothetical protein
MSVRRQDSLASRVGRIVLRQAPVRLSEIAEALALEHGPQRYNAVSSTVSALVHRGVLLKVGGRHGNTLYAHADQPVAVVIHDPLAEALIDIVCRVAEASGEPVTTAQILVKLEERGFTGLSADRVRCVLETLAHSSERKAKRSHSRWAEAKVLRVNHRSRGGRQRVYWSFPGGPVTPPAVTDTGDAVRMAICETEAALGRPASRAETALWAAVTAQTCVPGSPAASAASVVLTKRFSGRLNCYAFKDLNSAADGRIVTVRTHLTSRGAYPARYGTAATDAVAHAACTLDDVCRLLEPAAELRGIAALAELACAMPEPVLDRLVDARRALLLTEGLRHMAGSDPCSMLQQAGNLAEHARSILRRWVPYMSGQTREQEQSLSWLAVDTANVRALMDLCRGPVDPCQNTDYASVASTTGVPLQSFATLSVEANALTDRATDDWANKLAPARRTRGAQAGGVSANGEDAMRAWLDRPDTLALLVRLCGLPRSSAMISLAESVLGRVLRDAELVLHLHGEARQPRIRHALTVALGLLGNPPLREAAWADRSDYHAAVAYVTAVVLGVDDDERRLALIREADLWARGPAAEVTERTRASVEGGARLGALR